MFTLGIITVSDKGSKGERIDESGKLIKEIMEENGGYSVCDYKIVADEIEDIVQAIKEMSDQKKVNLILTTGGTGFSPRDVTPEATEMVIEKRVPGIPEAIRYYSLKITNKAMLSRATAGIRGETLIINMPGSPKAVKEALDIIISPLEHGLDILLSNAHDCARK